MRTSAQRLDVLKKDLSKLLKKHDCMLEVEQCDGGIGNRDTQTINVYSTACHTSDGTCVDQAVDCNLGESITQTSLDG
jgi:hypothetical protein